MENDINRTLSYAIFKFPGQGQYSIMIFSSVVDSSTRRRIVGLRNFAKVEFSDVFRKVASSSKMEERKFVTFWFCIIVVNTQLSYQELVVNVKTRGGQYTQQHLMADPEKDIVMIDFTMPDGARTTTLIDFSKVMYHFILLPYQKSLTSIITQLIQKMLEGYAFCIPY